MYSSCSIRTVALPSVRLRWNFGRASGGRETLSLPRRCLLDLERSGALLWNPKASPGPPGVRRGTRKERDVRRLTRRRHIDLGRVSSAFCCREV
ncbi:putative leader peptide [Streptomyces cyaneofuscatus]|uniref:putative leader peptide n=1 Tax=Streptomyces cyaneofuscatus TaxID=66883 RepID=UPI00382452ED